MNDRTSSRPKPRAPIADIVRVVSASLLFLVLAIARRLLGRRRRPGWSFGLEVLIAAYRGSWSVMPGMGIVRWRNVGDALSPLQTDGLVPRFVTQGLGAAEIEGVWLEPPDADGPVLLYFHGGGFCFASLRTHGNLIGALARAARARTLAMDYRLAPEHPAPAALEDALLAYRYVLAQQIPAKRIVLGGDSAGGTLVLQLLLALRDAGEPLPAAGVALSPWVDLGCSGASFQRNAAFDFVGEEHCRLAAASYLAGADPRRPDVSPLFSHLQGLPPLLVHAGEAEVLVDQIRSFVERAQAAGVDVRFSLYPDMVHVWHMMGSATTDARRAIDEVGAFVRMHAR
jgi:epsilon-lactone hydrolase